MRTNGIDSRLALSTILAWMQEHPGAHMRGQCGKHPICRQSQTTKIQLIVQEPGTWYAVLPLEWVYMFDPCCKMGQLDTRVADGDAGKSQSHNGMQTTEDTVQKQSSQPQV